MNGSDTPDYLCCSEYRCRRKQPIKINRSSFGDFWYAITRWKPAGELGIEAIEKHQLDDVISAALDVALQHMGEVNALVDERRATRAAHQLEKDGKAGSE